MQVKSALEEEQRRLMPRLKRRIKVSGRCSDVKREGGEIGPDGTTLTFNKKHLVLLIQWIRDRDEDTDKRPVSRVFHTKRVRSHASRGIYSTPENPLTFSKTYDKTKDPTIIIIIIINWICKALFLKESQSATRVKKKDKGLRFTEMLRREFGPKTPKTCHNKTPEN